MSKNSKSSKSVMAPGKPGTHAPKNVEKAQHRSVSFSETYGGTLSSRQPASRYPEVAVHSDNKRAAELLKSDRSNVDRSGKFFR
jgi:hypothetical protein